LGIVISHPVESALYARDLALNLGDPRLGYVGIRTEVAPTQVHTAILERGKFVLTLRNHLFEVPDKRGPHFRWRWHSKILMLSGKHSLPCTRGQDVMGKLGKPRITLIVETFIPTRTSGKHGAVHVRPVAGQGYRTDLQVRCNKKIHAHRPIGTRFRIMAMLTDNKGGTQYFSSHPDWDYKVLDDPPISN
jgi:hypothetical protein